MRERGGAFASHTRATYLRTFTFYLHDGAETIPAFEIELLDADIDAVAYAHRLLAKRPRYTHVEITEGERAVASIARNSGADAD